MLIHFALKLSKQHNSTLDSRCKSQQKDSKLQVLEHSNTLLLWAQHRAYSEHTQSSAEGGKDRALWEREL